MDSQHNFVQNHLVLSLVKNLRQNRKNAVKVGDFVGFYHQNYGEHIAGRVERLNQKTVSLITPEKKRWRVSYQLLYPIIDGEQIEILHRMENQLDVSDFAE